jgi:hypothetical protein
MTPRRTSIAALAAASLIFMSTSMPPAQGQSYSPAIARSIAKTQKPPLHGQHWMAITGKPLGATAGAMMFQRGGNAVDAACAMIAATSTMWDVLHWGGETQALTVATLGASSDVQRIDTISPETEKRYMDKYGAGRDDNFKRQVVGDGWIEFQNCEKVVSDPIPGEPVQLPLPGFEDGTYLITVKKVS